MDQQDLVQSFIERCEAGAPAEILAAKFQERVEQLGFRYFALCSHVDLLDPPPQSIMVHNYPPEWVRIYSERKLRYIDPILQRAERDPMPFFWDVAFCKDSLSPSQAKILAEASELGIAHGYTIPIHLSWMPGTPRCSCSVVPGNSKVDRWNYRLVELMANYLFIASLRRYASWRAFTSVKLSQREQQCLSLAAEGKDDWSIGQLLHLGEGTVHTYVERAKQRYGVVTRMQAVVRALAAGQISFGDVLRTQDGEELIKDGTWNK